MEKDEIMTLVSMCLKDEGLNQETANDISKYVTDSVLSSTTDEWTKDILERMGRALTKAATFIPEKSQYELMDTD